MKIRILLLTMIITGAFIPHLFPDDKDQVIAILPFINTGAGFKDLDETLFISYFYFYFNKLRYFTAVYPSRILNYRAEKFYTTKDLYTLAVLHDMLKEFKSDFILGGEFRVENKVLKVNIDIFGNDRKLVIQREYEAKIKTDASDALLEIVFKVIKAFSHYNPETGYFIADTDYPCSLYVNGVVFGRTPGKFLLPPGSYDMEIVYEDALFRKTVYRGQAVLEKNGITDPGKIKVLVTISVTANVESDVFIDGIKTGVTDVSIKIPVNHEYVVDVVYTDEQKEKRCQKKTITTLAGNDITLEFLFPCRIKMTAGNLPLSGRVNELKGYEKLPYIFDNLEPGKYHIQVVLEDYTWRRDWVVYDEKLLLYNTQTAVIDRSDFIFKRYWGLCFIPSAAQFYTFEPVKGIVILTLSAISLAESITTYYLMNDNMNYIDIRNTYRTACWGGIAFFGCVYLYSCIDGMVTMHHLHKMFYPDY